MVPLFTNLPYPHHHSSVVHKQRSHRKHSRHTEPRPLYSVGTWQEAVSLAEYYKEAASISVSLVQAQMLGPQNGLRQATMGRTRKRFDKIHTKDGGSSQTSNLPHVII